MTHRDRDPWRDEPTVDGGIKQQSSGNNDLTLYIFACCVHVVPIFVCINGGGKETH